MASTRSAVQAQALPAAAHSNSKVLLGKRAPQPKPQRSLWVLLDTVVSHASLLSWLLAAVGLLGLLALPLLERSISFDENALLAGSARPTVRSKSPEAYRDGRAFAASLQESLFSGQPFTAALQQRLQQQLRVQVYNHTYAVAGNGLSSSSSGSRTCTNVHAVLSSRRGDGKEALLLATPINHQATSTDFEQDASGAMLALALGAALLRHLGSAAPWLAKEVLWLLPDASCGLVPALQAWADAYQRPVLLPPASSAAGPGLAHFGRAGVLQQGLLLELPSGSGNRLQVSLEGHEGLLPKLDLFWLIRWYCYSYVRAPVELTHMGWTFALPGSGQPAAAVTTHLNSLLSLLTGRFSSSSAVHPALLALQQHVLKFTTACQFMWRQARGLPTGGHAPFKDLMADVATLRVLIKDPQGFVAGPMGFTGATGNVKRSSSRGVRPQAVLGSDELLAQLCDAVELLLRSCSGLVERFHHSLFLYVLTDLEHYVSVERYIGPLAALVCVLALQAAAARRPPADTTKPAAAAAAQPAPKRRLAAALLAALRSIPERLQRRQQRPAAPTAATAPDPPVLQQQQPEDQAAAGQQQQQQQPLMVLPPYDTLLLPTQEEAAAARSQWVAAIKAVAAAHALCAAAGLCLRNAPALLAQLQQPAAVARWLSQPGEHVVELSAAAALVIACMVAADAAASAATAAASTAAAKGTDSSRSGSSSAALLLRRVIAVQLSVAAAACAAAACLNWALSYVLCLLLVPLAIGCSPPPVGGSSMAGIQQGTSSSSSSSRRSSAVKAWAVLLCCSPVSVMLLLAVLSSGGAAAAAQPQWLADCVLGSSLGAYTAFWAVYLPGWCLTAWSVWVHSCC